MKRLRLVPLVAVLALQALTVSAQDAPAGVRIRAYLAPDAHTLRLVARLPLSSITGVAWPLDGLRLDLLRVESALASAAREGVAKKVDVYEGDRRLAPRVGAARVSLPSDTQFDSYESALAHVTAPGLSGETDVIARQALVDVLLEYEIESADSRWSIDPRFDTQDARASVGLTFLPARGGERGFEFQGNPGLVRLEPRWFEAADRLSAAGVAHLLGRIDYLLLLLCLLMPYRQVRSVIRMVIAVTVAQTIGIIASAYGMVPDVGWFRSLVDTLLAVSIAYVALENIVTPTPRRRVAIAFASGLAYGFWFSFPLRDSLQFAGQYVLVSTVAFAAGIGFGQLLALIAIIGGLSVLYARGVVGRAGTIVISALAMHAAWHWMVDRGTLFLRYPVEAPAFDAALLAFALRWVTLGVALAAAVWLIDVVRRSRDWSESAVGPRWRRS